MGSSVLNMYDDVFRRAEAMYEVMAIHETGVVWNSMIPRGLSTLSVQGIARLLF